MVGETVQVKDGNQAGQLDGQAPLVFVVRVHYVAGKDHEMDFTIVMGDTYPFKELLKKHGFGWVPAEYLWRIDKDIAKQIAEELRKAGAEVMEVSRLLPDIKEFNIVEKRIAELIERGVIEDVAKIAKEIGPVSIYVDDNLLPFDMQIRYIVNIVRRKYQINADFEDVLKKMLEGQVGEERGWLARERLQKLTKAYVRLRDIGLTDMPTSLIRMIDTIYESKFKRKR